jgi:tetratricopeptide (TPR) repeat protein
MSGTAYFSAMLRAAFLALVIGSVATPAHALKVQPLANETTAEASDPCQVVQGPLVPLPARSAFQACIDASAPERDERNTALLVLAYGALQEDKAEEALSFLNQLHEPQTRYANNVQYHLMAHFAYEATDNQERAEEIAQSMHALLTSGKPVVPPGSVGAGFRRLILGIYKDDQDKRAPLLDAYSRWIALNAAEAASQVGILDNHQQTDRAIDAGRRAMTRFSGDASLLNNYCYALARAGRGDVGLPFCLKAGRLDPNQSHIEHSISVAYAAVGDCERATAAYDRSEALLAEAMKRQFAKELARAVVITDLAPQPNPPFSCPLDIATLAVPAYRMVRILQSGRIEGIPPDSPATLDVGASHHSEIEKTSSRGNQGLAE